MEIADLRAVSGGEDHGVDALAFAVAPHGVVAVEAGEERPRVRVARGDRGAMAAIVDHDPATEEARPERSGVEAGADEPPVQVAAERALRHEPKRRARGDAHARDGGELGGDLHRAVAAADDDHAASGVALGVAVLGGVNRCAREAVETWKGGSVRCAEAAGRGDRQVRCQLKPALGHDRESVVGASDAQDALAGADVSVEPARVRAQVLDELVARRVAPRVAGEPQSRQLGEARGREEREAVVVALPRADGLVAGFQDHGCEAGAAGNVGGGQACLAAADDGEIDVFHVGVLVGFAGADDGRAGVLVDAVGLGDLDVVEAGVVEGGRELEAREGGGDAAGPLLHVAACGRVHVGVGDHVADGEAPAGAQYPRGLADYLVLVGGEIDRAVGDVGGVAAGQFEHLVGHVEPDRELEYEWKLRLLMAERGIFNSKPLVALLAEHGIRPSDSQVWRMVTGKPERLNLQVLVALCKILDCTPNDLIQPVERAARAALGGAGRRGRADRPQARESAHHAGAVAEPASRQAGQCCGAAGSRCRSRCATVPIAETCAGPAASSGSLPARSAAPSVCVASRGCRARSAATASRSARASAPPAASASAWPHGSASGSSAAMRALRRARAPALQAVPPRAAAGSVGRWRAAVLALRRNEVSDLELRALRHAEQPAGAGRLCSACALGDALDRLRAEGDPAAVAQLAPFLDSLHRHAHPTTVIGWLARCRGAPVLRAMIAGQIAITHEALDEHEVGQATAYLRSWLVAHGVLEPREELLGPPPVSWSQVDVVVVAVRNRRLCTDFSRALAHVPARARPSESPAAWSVSNSTGERIPSVEWSLVGL